jgi:signal peptide peptidase SppA
MNLYSEILRGAFFIEPFHGMSMAMMMHEHFEKGTPIARKGYLDDDQGAESTKPKNYTFIPHTIDEQGNVAAIEFEEHGLEVKNSVAVIPVRDELTKYDYCGVPGTMTLEKLFDKAAASPNVKAIVMPLDTPGGSATPSMKLAETIKNAAAQKPVFAFVDEMAASGGMMIASAATKIYASSKFDVVGSIGTMMSWANFKKMYEMKGVEFHEVYATLSTNKNKLFRDANKGNYKNLVENMLDPLNEEFIGMVKANRAGRLDLSNKEVFTGEIFEAQNAVSFGLIDGIANFDTVINEARASGKPKKKVYVV